MARTDLSKEGPNRGKEGGEDLCRDDQGDEAEGGTDQGGGAIAAIPTHYFVDVPNPEESTYDVV
jgi:hypothetical protein